VNLLDVDEDEALEAAALDGGEDQGIDFLYTDHTNERVVVLQAHFPENSVKVTPKAKWDSIVAAIPYLEQPEHFRAAGRPELASAAEEALEHFASYEVLIGTASFGAKSGPVTTKLSTWPSCEIGPNDFRHLSWFIRRRRWPTWVENRTRDALNKPATSCGPVQWLRQHLHRRGWRMAGGARA
jgi:hypothetical protein